MSVKTDAQECSEAAQDEAAKVRAASSSSLQA